MYGSLFGASSNHHQEEETSNKPLNTQISLSPVHPHHSSSRDDALLDATTTTNNKSSTATSCVLNLANTIIGAGMLGLPGALGGTGYVTGISLMIGSALFSAHGLILLAKAAQLAGLPSSFYTVARAAVPQYTVWIDLAVALKCFGVATGYLITVGDCMVDALDHILVSSNSSKEEESPFIRTILSRQFWVVGAVLAVLPVSFYRTLDELKKTSALALVFVVLLAFGIVAYAHNWADPCLDTTESCRGELEAYTTPARTMAKLPIFVFSFTCHQNIFPIVNEIQARTQTRLNGVVAASIGLALAVFLLVALEGYRTFGSNVRGDILLNYPETKMVTILRLCIAFMLTLHYPLQLDPSRRCITSLIQVVQQQWSGPSFHRRDSNVTTEQSSIVKEESITNQQDDNILFYAITIGFLLASFGIAMVVDDLGVVLAMVGATGSTLVSYILPGLIYLKIRPGVWDVSQVGAAIQLVTGCFIMPVALYFVVTGN